MTLFRLCFAAVFFAYAKLHAGMEPERSARNAVRFGLMAVSFAAVTVLPELILKMMGVSPVTSYPFGMYLMNGMAALFILFFLLGMHHAVPAPAAAGRRKSRLRARRRRRRSKPGKRMACRILPMNRGLRGAFAGGLRSLGSLSPSREKSVSEK